MAGKRGRSGGARPGAGQKPAVVLSDNPALCTDDPVTFLRALMKDPKIPIRMRFQASVDLYGGRARSARTGSPTRGKKERAAEAADRVIASGRFAPMNPPGSVVPFRRRGQGDDAA